MNESQTVKDPRNKINRWTGPENPVGVAPGVDQEISVKVIV
jgi:hypothetical protein